MNLPRARSSNLLEQSLNKELLIYDLTTHKAFSLNETSRIVYQACDAGKTFEDLKRKHKFTEDSIYLTLDELAEKNLLVNYESGSNFQGLTRREAIKKVGLASMIALPVITGIIAPTAAQAASGCDTTQRCSATSDCPAPCTACNGAQTTCNDAGYAEPSSCTNIGSPCTIQSSGAFCDPARGCVYPEGSGNGGNGSACRINADCTGAGICTAVQGNCA